MNSREHDPLQLDVESFAKGAEALDGEWPLACLDRLAASVLQHVPGASDAVRWHAEGERREVRGGPAQIWLHVTAHADVMMQCQRCLQAVGVPIAVERSFMFVHGEKAAAELDLDSEDDVLALARAFDLQALIEDELLLALPLVPRHGVCPQPLMVPGAELPDEKAPHPFAALAALKKGKLPN